jgi:hypothetical protein
MEDLNKTGNDGELLCAMWETLLAYFGGKQRNPA